MKSWRLLFRRARPDQVSKQPVSIKIDELSNYDQIGPADKISNLRKCRYLVPRDESRLERDYRQLREKVFEFNNDYWTQQNLKFLDSKKRYLQRVKMREQYEQRLQNNASQSSQSNEKSDLIMNEFYQKFLNDNYYSHYEYNKNWYKYNFMLLWMALRVHAYRMRKRWLLKAK